MSPIAQLLVAFGLLFLNALFVAAEFAVVAARRSRLQPRADAGHRGARITLGAMERVSVVLAGAQLGITICSLGLGAVAEPAVAHLLTPLFEAVHLPQSLIEPTALTLALTIVVYLHVALGEMVPKNLALAVPEPTALALVPTLAGFGRLLGPAIRLLNMLANGLIRLLGVTPVSEVASAYTADQLQSILDQSHREGLLDDRHALLTRAIALGERRAHDVMVAWEKVVTLPPCCTPVEAENTIARTGYSRFPLPLPSSVPAPDREPPHPRWGYLHVQDLLRAQEPDREQPLPADRIRPLPEVASGDDLDDVLFTMRRSGAHLAQVIDHDGAPIGAVFFEDLLEELIGEVHDGSRPA